MNNGNLNFQMRAITSQGNLELSDLSQANIGILMPKAHILAYVAKLLFLNPKPSLMRVVGGLVFLYPKINIKLLKNQIIHMA
jgi:hypothetical protein